MSEVARTFADALREARERAIVRPQGGVQLMGAAMAEDALQGDELAALEARIVPTTGPSHPPNPRVQCDFCPRKQLADMCVEVEPGRYACDGCMARRERATRDG